MWVASQIGPFAQQLRRSLSQHDEDVPRRRLFCGLENAPFTLQFEGAPRMSKKDSPALRDPSRSNDPRDGNACSISREVGTSLPVPHGIRGAPAIQRMASLTEAEDRAIAKAEMDRAG